MQTAPMAARSPAFRAAPAGRRPAQVRAAAVQLPPKPAKALQALNVTKSSLINSQDGRTTRNIDGTVYTITWSASDDSISVVDRQRSLTFPVEVDAKTNVIKIDLGSPTPAATGAVSFVALQQLLKADGPGPEAVNGRLAMAAFLAVVAVEAATGRGLVEQAASLPGAVGALALAAAVTTASLAPAFTGAVSVYRLFPSPRDAYADRQLPYYFSPLAEVLNGRAAMVGLAGLLATELWRGGALFVLF